MTEFCAINPIQLPTIITNSCLSKDIPIALLALTFTIVSRNVIQCHNGMGKLSDFNKMSGKSQRISSGECCMNPGRKIPSTLQFQPPYLFETQESGKRGKHLDSYLWKIQFLCIYDLLQMLYTALSSSFFIHAIL